jgi:hypothetical protein
LPNISYARINKKSDRLDDYHLHEMDLASGKVRQLTFGLGFADYEDAFLPDASDAPILSGQPVR